MVGKLSVARLQSLKPTGKTQKIGDGGGLFLFISPAGGMSWRYLYRWTGKQQTLTIGKYPQISLKDARIALAEAKAQLERGINPAEEKQKEKEKARESAEKVTFAAVAREYYEKKTTELSAGYRKLYKQRLERNLIPYIGEIPIDTLKRTDVLSCLRVLEGRGHVETAHRLGIIASQVCRYARACGLVEYDVAEGIGEALSHATHTPRAALTDAREIGALLRAIDEYPGYLSTRYALRIMPYVFVRSAELRGAHWSEIDFDQALWTVPANRMKRRKEHIVPLARQVLELLSELREFSENKELVFPSPFSSTRPVTDVALLNALRRLGYAKGAMDIHGFRSIASTALNEMKFRPDIIEMQLSHTQKDSVRAAYNRALYIEERKEMMQKYADYLDSLKNLTSD